METPEAEPADGEAAFSAALELEERARSGLAVNGRKVKPVTPIYK